MAPSPVPWKAIPFRFAYHILIGAAMFVMVGAVAVGLHFFVEWMRASGVATWIVTAARWIEYGLFGIDTALFALFVGRTAVHHGQEMLQAEVS